jgi:hypothetical protein
MKLQKTDLRSVTRDAETLRTEVEVNMGYGPDGRENWVKWLVFGEATLRKMEGSEKVERWWLAAYLTAGVTDGEHDSAYALRLPLIAVSFGNIYHHRLHVSAVIEPAHNHHFREDFHVPLPGYDPAGAEDVHICEGEHCSPHPMVDAYVPEYNAELYELVSGREVRIYIGQPYEESQ